MIIDFFGANINSKFNGLLFCGACLVSKIVPKFGSNEKTVDAKRKIETQRAND